MPRAALAILLVACLLGHALWVALEPITAADLWVALAAGRWIVAHHQVPSVDVFSYTFAGAPWFNQEWLSQVVLFGLYDRLGSAALAALRVVLVTVSFGLATWIAFRRSGSFALAVLVACAAAFACRPFLDIRSQLFTFPSALLVLATLDAYRRGASAAVLVIALVVIGVWVNLHYGFIYGIAMCGLCATTETLATVSGRFETALRPERLVALLALPVVALAVALLNPQGLHALTFPFVILQQRAWLGVIEWTPPVLFQTEPFNPLAFTYLLFVELAVVGLVLTISPRRLDVFQAALAAVTATMALTSRRFVPLFALVSVPFLAESLALVAARVGLVARPAVRSAVVWVVAVLATLHVAWRVLPELQRGVADGFFATMTRSAYFPEGGAEFLRLNPLPARLFNLYTWSGYVLFQAPDRRVLIDGRAHQVYPESLWRESFAVELGRPEWEGILDTYEVSLVLWLSEPTADAGFRPLLDQLEASPHWIRIYDDAQAAIFAHTDRARAWVEAFQAFTLRYPDLQDAQFFVGEAMLKSGAFERSRRHFLEAFVRHPGLHDLFRDALLPKLAERTQGSTDPALWFQLAFVRDVLGDRREAAEAYRTALDAGAPDPLAGFARDARARLDPERLP